MSNLIHWITEHWLEIFGAFAGILYVLLEIRQNIWLWPVGIVTSSVYIIVFFTSKFYADMSLQVYYVVISFYGWYVWRHGHRNPPSLSAESFGGQSQEPSFAFCRKLRRAKPATRTETGDRRSSSRPKEVNQKPETSNQQPATLPPTPTPLRLAMKLAVICIILHAAMWYVLSRHTDSPVAGWDSFTTALSVIATWMLARKYIEHWLIWIVVNIVSMILYLYKGLYPTTLLFLVYTIMAVAGYREWRSDMKKYGSESEQHQH